MENALALAHVMGPVYLVVGLSILLFVKAWESLLSKYESSHDTLMPYMLMYGILGAIVINMYNVWSWDIWLLVTLTGWALAIKSAAFFLLPGSIVKKCMAIKKQVGMLYLGGVIGVVVGAVLTYYSYFV